VQELRYKALLNRFHGVYSANPVQDRVVRVMAGADTIGEDELIFGSVWDSVREQAVSARA
jgi:hypothetical protein